jgi:translation initiation factor IF-2
MQAVKRGPVVPVGPARLPTIMSVKHLAEALRVAPAEVQRELIKMRIMASINQQIDYATAAMVATELGLETEEETPVEPERGDQALTDSLRDVESDPDAVPRPPVVTIMGHVDHGKTKLLDAIRQTRVAEGEAGGITQHIGAYQVDVQGRKITFLDTPGHEAFTAMRARGAQVTDIAVLVVAADDGVMPQTLEAISHARAADVPIVVAINKIDREGANPARVKQQLAEADVVAEEYGGDVPMVEVSARENLGIDDLLDVILLVADIRGMKANPHRPAVGTIIEARVDKTRGPVATVLVQNGTLNLKDYVVVGHVHGRIRAMNDDKGQRIRKAGPATPAEILGLLDAPQAGDTLEAVADEREARARAEERARNRAPIVIDRRSAATLERMAAAQATGKTNELRLIVKADVQGSLGAIRSSLERLHEEDERVDIAIVHAGIGGIGESDIMLAAASGAIVVGFNVRPDPAARRVADNQGVDIRYYNVIYTLLDEIKAAMAGMLEPEYRDVTSGYAEVRQIFRLPNREVAAGLRVIDGKILRTDFVRVLRDGVVVHDGKLGSLKRFKDDVREVAAGLECGITVDGYADVQEGDQIEFYHKEQIK